MTIFKQEKYDGSDCTGTTGGQNRTITLSNTGETSNDYFFVFVNGILLSLTTEYTVVHSVTSSVITFLNSLWDDQKIIVSYNRDIIAPEAEDNTDFSTGPLVDFGVTVTRTPVTATTSNIGGQKTYTDGTNEDITVVFSNPNQKYPLDKSGITESADAIMYTKATQTINKYDKILYNSKNYRVDTISERLKSSTVVYKKVELFLI